MTDEETYRARAKAVRTAARAHLLDIRRGRLARRSGPVAVMPMSDSVLSPSDVDHFSDDDLLPGSVGEPDPAAEAEVLLCLAAPAAEASSDVTPADPLSRSADVMPDPESIPAAIKSRGEPARQKVKPKGKRKSSAATSGPSGKARLQTSCDASAEVLDGKAADLAVLQAAMAELDAETAEGTPSEPVATQALDATADAAETANAFDLHSDTFAEGDISPDCELPAPPAPEKDMSLAQLPGAGPGLIWMLEQVGIHNMDDLADADAESLSMQLGLVGQILNVGSWIGFARDAVR